MKTSIPVPGKLGALLTAGGVSAEIVLTRNGAPVGADELARASAAAEMFALLEQRGDEAWSQVRAALASVTPAAMTVDPAVAKGRAKKG